MDPHIALKSLPTVTMAKRPHKINKIVFKRFDLSKYIKLLSVNNVGDFALQSNFDIYVKPKFLSCLSAPFDISLKQFVICSSAFKGF